MIDHASRGKNPIASNAIAFAAAVIFGVALYRISPPEAVPQSKQAVGHLNAAVAIAQGQSLLEGDGGPGKPYPPLYRLLLAGPHRAGLDWWHSALVINSAAFAAGLFSTFFLSRACGLGCGAWLCTAAFAALSSNHYLYFSAIPELSFTACWMGAAACAAAVLQTGRPGTTHAMGLLVSAACLLRYIGLFTAFPACALAILMRRGDGLRRRLQNLLTLCAWVLLPMSAWVVRNLVLIGIPSGMSRTGARDAELKTGLADNLSSTLQSCLIDWFRWPAIAQRRYIEERIELPRPFLQNILLGIALLLLCIALVHWRVKARCTVAHREPAPEASAARVHVLLHWSIYQVALLLLWTFTNNDPINVRFTAPSYPFALILAGVGAAALCRGEGAGVRRVLVGLAVAAVLSLQAMKSVHNFGDIAAEDRARPYLPTKSTE